MSYSWYVNQESQVGTQDPPQQSFLPPQSVPPQSSSSGPQFNEGFKEGFEEGVGYGFGYQEGMKDAHSNSSLPQPSTSVPLPPKHEDHPSDTSSHPSTSVDHKDTTSKPSTSSDSNPLGIPAPSKATTSDKDMPPTDTEKSTSTSSKPPVSEDPHNSNPLGIPTTNTHAAQAPEKDAVKPVAPTKDLPVPPHVPGSGAEVPESTPTNSATVPANPPAKEKAHKGLKTKFREWREKRKSGGSSTETGSVHPVDTRTGKQLPSEDELSARMFGPGGHDEAPALKKDINDATGKSVTGSDANPSKASNPFKAPTPALHQAPIDAKAQ